MTALIALCLPIPASAATLRLSTNADLPVLDDKKVSSSLLRDADSVELDDGSYQLMFRVGKTIHLSNSEKRSHISPPLVISSDAQLISRTNFRLPRLEGEQEADHFDAAPRLELLGDDVIPTPVKLDVLIIISTTKTIGYEIEVERYNKSARCVSLPRLVTVMADDSTLFSGVSELDAILSQSQVFTRRRLEHWSKLANPQV